MPTNQGVNFCSCRSDSNSAGWYCHICERLVVKGDRVEIPQAEFRAFRELFRPMVREAIARRTTFYDEPESESIVDEIVHKVFQRIGQYSGEGPFKAWIQRIARNHYLDLARKQITKQEKAVTFTDPEVLAAIYHGRHPELPPDNDSSIEWLRRFLRPEQFDLLYLRYVEDYTIGEAAEELGLTEGQGRYRIGVAKEAGKRILELKQWLDTSPTDTDRRYRAIEAAVPPNLFALLHTRFVDGMSAEETADLHGLTTREYETQLRHALDSAKAVDALHARIEKATQRSHNQPQPTQSPEGD